METIREVVCVHGLWSHGAAMYLIGRRLEREHGLRVHVFNYPSVRGTLDENAAALADFIRHEGLAATHIFAHSLGGIIALRMLASESDAGPGRIVCAGSPLTGSRAVELLSRRDWAQHILGHSVADGVLRATANTWASRVCAERDVGIIAGTIPAGFGMLFTAFDGEHDGTVAVAETRLDGARDHICLPVNHYGMLVSRLVADQAAAFFARGKFLRDS